MVLLLPSSFISGSFTAPPLSLTFLIKESSWGDTMNKTWHKKVSLGSKPEDQGGELSPHCLDGAPYRYLSGQRAGGGCFGAKQSGKWWSLSILPLLTRSASCWESQRCKEKAEALSPLNADGCQIYNLMRGVHVALAVNARGHFEKRSSLGKWQRAVPAC